MSSYTGHSHGPQHSHWLNIFRSKWWGTLGKVLTFISSGRSTPVDRDKAVMEMNLKSGRLNVSGRHCSPLAPLSACKLIAFGWESCSGAGWIFRDVRFVRKHLNFVCHGIAREVFRECDDTTRWVCCHGNTVTVDMTFQPSLVSPDQKDVRGHPDHHPGHGDHWRLRRVRVFPPQPIHRVGQVHCVRDVPQQAQHCQEEGQPAGDGAVLLHGERRCVV